MIKKKDIIKKSYSGIYFLSDIHLGAGSKEDNRIREDILVRFLSTIEKDSALVIVGDLFDYWFEFRQVYQRGFFRSLSAFYDCTQRGVDIHYLIGNHDFFHRDFFYRELGVNLIEDSLVIVIGDKKLFAAHGDGYIKNDLGYRILKSVLRNKTIQFFYGLLHPDFGLWLARKTSKGSRKYTGQKNYGGLDSLAIVASEKIAEGYDFVIFGHTHKRKFEKIENGYYINLGSWFHQPCFGYLSNNKFTTTDLV